jgi:hypothetical protein
MPTIFDYGDMHDLGESSFRSIQERIIREREARLRWNPADSSLTRQAWDYQQKLADLMGEVPSMGDIASDAQNKLKEVQTAAGIDDSVVSTCGKAALVGVFAGFVAGKVGLVKTLLGVGAVYLVTEWMSKK